MTLKQIVEQFLQTEHDLEINRMDEATAQTQAAMLRLEIEQEREVRSFGGVQDYQPTTPGGGIADHTASAALLTGTELQRELQACLRSISALLRERRGLQYDVWVWQTALTWLHPTDRQLIVLRFRQRLTWERVAEEMSMSDSGVRDRASSLGRSLPALLRAVRNREFRRGAEDRRKDGAKPSGQGGESGLLW